MINDWHALYFGVLALVGLERLFELRLSSRHATWSFARGGIESGRGHYWPMVLLHTGLLVMAPLESAFLVRGDFGIPQAMMAGGLAGAQALRYWAIWTLGAHWNVRVIVVPTSRAIVAGPYRYISHPNYVAVILEGLCLPLLGGAWRTALLFFVLNAWFLRVRIRCEQDALQGHYANYAQVGGRA